MNISYFKPGEVLNFNSVSLIRHKIFKQLKLDKNQVFCLDLTEVTHCDSAGLALLIEAKKLCQEYNKIFKVMGVSAKTQALAEFCGVNDILE